MTRKILSLDIRTDKIAVLLIKTSLKGNCIEALSSVSIPDISADNDEYETRLERALGEAMKGIDVSAAECVVSIPPNMVSYRNLRVPFKDRKKIRQVLPFELEPTLPFPVEEVVADFQTVRQTDQTDIIVCAVKTSELTAIIEVLKKHDIDPQAVTTGGLPSAMCLAKLANIARQFVFLDINPDCCTMFAVSSGDIYLARTFQFPSTSPDKKADSIISSMSQFIASFEAFYDVVFEPSIICLSGEWMDEDLFKEKLDQRMNVSIQSVNVLKDVMNNTQTMDGIDFSPKDFNSALSLAAAEIPGINMINFYGERTMFKRYWEENKNDIIKTGSLALFVFIVFMFNILLEARYLDKSIRSLNQKITFIFQTTFPDVAKIVDPVQQMKVMIQDLKDKSSYAGEVQDVKLNIDILNEISQQIPASIDVEFTQFVRGDENILISGQTDTFNSVDEIKGNLEKSKLMKTITINSANLDAASNRVQFKLKVDL